MNLAKLAEFGITATVTQAGKLRIEAQKGAISQELRQEIAQNRDSLLSEVNMVNLVNMKSSCTDSHAHTHTSGHCVHRHDNDTAQEQVSAPDRHSYPHTEAANAQELARMARRLATFNRLGLPSLDAERQADKLLIRDREHDDRRMCLECAILTGGMDGWRCGAFRQRGAREPGLPADLVGMLQRCPVFVAGEPRASGYYTTARPSNGPKMPSLVNARGPWLSARETAAAQKYHQHHADCPQCQSAGRGHTKHCGAGAALWNDYTKGNAK